MSAFERIRKTRPVSIHSAKLLRTVRLTRSDCLKSDLDLSTKPTASFKANVTLLLVSLPDSRCRQYVAAPFCGYNLDQPAQVAWRPLTLAWYSSKQAKGRVFYPALCFKSISLVEVQQRRFSQVDEFPIALLPNAIDALANCGFGDMKLTCNCGLSLSIQQHFRNRCERRAKTRDPMVQSITVALFDRCFFWRIRGIAKLTNLRIGIGEKSIKRQNRKKRRTVDIVRNIGHDRLPCLFNTRERLRHRPKKSADFQATTFASPRRTSLTITLADNLQFLNQKISSVGWLALMLRVVLLALKVTEPPKLGAHKIRASGPSPTVQSSIASFRSEGGLSMFAHRRRMSTQYRGLQPRAYAGEGKTP